MSQPKVKHNHLFPAGRRGNFCFYLKYYVATRNVIAIRFDLLVYIKLAQKSRNLVNKGDVGQLSESITFAILCGDIYSMLAQKYTRSRVRPVGCVRTSTGSIFEPPKTPQPLLRLMISILRWCKNHPRSERARHSPGLQLFITQGLSSKAAKGEKGEKGDIVLNAGAGVGMRAGGVPHHTHTQPRSHKARTDQKSEWSVP